jgi:NAD(P)-dependent dehydrogenase (short-subunit alcohol dehydrogenase family)
METPFNNKVVIITGSSFGIGKSTAIAFAQKGAKVVLSDWKQDEDTLSTILANGGDDSYHKI